MSPNYLNICFFIFLVMSSLSFAQEDERGAIIETVEGFFTAIRTADKRLLESILVPNSLNISTSEVDGGTTQLTTLTHENMVSVLTRPGRLAIERAWDETILIQGSIAIFWAPYDFHVDGEFSHCGVDSFQLIKKGDKWLITNASWTREIETCQKSPLGPLD
ncbi:MAG: hypothetical protein P8K27_09665 [Gammaproteobacteria bacterium]|nr:hypothetical protein [Gammaproteobacteria bacterium]